MQAPGMQFVYITLCKIRGLHRINSISNRGSSENNGLHQKTNSGDGNGDPLQHSCLENSMNRGAWQAIVLLLLLLSRFSHIWLWQPHRWQPTRLPHPWDSPGKNTGVGCHFLLQYMKVKSESEVAQLCPTLSDPLDCSPPGSSDHGIFQAMGGKETQLIDYKFTFFKKKKKQQKTDKQVPTSRIVVLKLLANYPHDEMSIAKQIKMMDRYLD